MIVTNNPFGGKTYTENLTAPRDGWTKTVADAILENERRAQNAFGQDCTDAELTEAYSGLRGKTIPRQMAEMAIQIARLKKDIRELKESK